MTDWRTVRNGKIAAKLSGKVAPIVCVMESHGERLEQIFGDIEIDGSPVVWAGISGATFDDLATYIPWSAIAATTPRKIFFQCGVNSAIQGLYLDSNSVMPAPYTGAMVVLNAISCAYSAVGGTKSKLVLMSDPPLEQAYGADPKAVHTYARMMFYAATLPWTTFGWSTAPGNSDEHFTFIDEMSLRAIPGGSPASSDYSTPSYAAPGDTIDGAHMSHTAYAAIMADIVSNV